MAATPPHLSLTMPSLGAKEPPCQQNTKSNRLDNKIQNKGTTTKKHNMHKGDHSHQLASQHAKVLLKMITITNTFLDIHNYIQKEKEEKKKERERKVERSYQVRCCVHLISYLLRTMLRGVEGISATPSNLKIQPYRLDAVKALGSLSNTPACMLEWWM